MSEYPTTTHERARERNRIRANQREIAERNSRCLGRSLKCGEEQHADQDGGCANDGTGCLCVCHDSEFVRAEKKPGINAPVPDRIDYDDNDELDDVVVNNCDAHLERLDTGRWYLGLYGSDGRTLQITIGSKTGRAVVTGVVTYEVGFGDAASDAEKDGGQ